MRSRFAITLFAACWLTSFSKAQEQVDAAFAGALQAKLDSCVNVYGLPGISVSLFLPEDRYWSGSSGLADIYSQEMMDTSFLFQQASVTKLFTTAMVMQLVDEGVVSLDDSIGAYLPPIANVPGGVRLRNLMRHRSGISDFLSDPGVVNAWLLTPNTIWDPADAITQFGDAPNPVQGGAFNYSNTNFVLLGMMVAEVTGMDLASALRARIIEPLGLEHTFLPPVEELEGELVPGWSSLSVPNAYTDDMTGLLGRCFASMVGGAGALISTPSDVSRFTRALFAGDLFPLPLVDTLRVMTSIGLGPNTTGYGLGTMRYAFNGETYYGHSGDINGFTLLTIQHATDGITLSIGINRNNAPRGPIAAALLQVVEEQLSVDVGSKVFDVQDILVYPNPAKERLQLGGWSGPIRLELMDARGRTIREPQAAVRDHAVIDLSGWVPGAYHIVLTSANGTRLERAFIVE